MGLAGRGQEWEHHQPQRERGKSPRSVSRRSLAGWRQVRLPARGCAHGSIGRDGICPPSPLPRAFLRFLLPEEHLLFLPLCCQCQRRLRLRLRLRQCVPLAAMGSEQLELIAAPSRVPAASHCLLMSPPPSGILSRPTRCRSVPRV